VFAGGRGEVWGFVVCKNEIIKMSPPIVKAHILNVSILNETVPSQRPI
jgi:hypothetical protein